MAGKHCDPIDHLVGRNIRILRQERRMSQSELGLKIGVTAQQVQKYECGSNRVGSGRLFKIASILSAPISAFYKGADDPATDAGLHPLVALLAEPHALRMLHAFCALQSMDLRRSIAELALALAPEPPTSNLEV